MDNETAAGATITLVAVFLLSCILFVLIGFGVDKIVAINISMLQNLPTSQMRFDIFNILLMIFEFEPFIIIIGTCLNVWVVSTRSQSGEADLSGMLLGMAELIIVTLGVIALAMFGGAAIETVINVMNGISLVANAAPGLYSAVIFIAPLFYGLCVIGVMGAIIQFLMLCVQTVDYGSGY